jgi:ATP-binding cassette subfamily C protein EexD
MGRALAPLDMMIASWKGFSDTRAAYGRLKELLHEMGSEKERMALPDPEGNVLLRGVVAGPPGSDENILRGVEFGLSKGTVLGVVGPSAAGKSTLARVMLGLWPIRAGEVRLDGADINQWSRDALGPHIGYLPQDIELFDGTVSENIARFGSIDSEQVVAAAQLAGVHEMILKLPEGYDTVIGQSGGALSGGQRQRIGLARAVYGNPILVVLDEPNSNLDDIGEQALLCAISELKKRQVTVVLITHRATILGAVDQLLAMHEGQVVAVGPRDEVLQKIAPAKNPKKITAPLSRTVPIGG